MTNHPSGNKDKSQTGIADHLGNVLWYNQMTSLSLKDKHFMIMTKKYSLCKFFEPSKLSYSLSLFGLSYVNKDQVCLRIFHRKVSTNPACGNVLACKQQNKVSSSVALAPSSCLMYSEHKPTCPQLSPVRHKESYCDPLKTNSSLSN